MSFTFIDLCDAIATDLAPLATAAARLGPGSTAGEYLDWRYVPPDELTMERAPWLAIYSPSTAHTLVATPADYMDDDDIEIEWAIAIGDLTEQGGAGIQARIKAVMAAAAPILDQIRTYADGMPSPFDNQVVGTLTSTTRSTDRGFVWSQTSRLTINSAGIE